MRMAGRWWLAAVEMSAVHSDGRTVHHVQTPRAGHSGTYHRTYRWPPPGKLRIGYPPAAPPRRL
ncbi:hypothetical protein [Streptomyces sp. NPDC058394]|uniref:hypothetical protein n=1 Tax=unclassified Streptomyces TaxID=2593676 RepID=UPI0036460B9A